MPTRPLRSSPDFVARFVAAATIRPFMGDLRRSRAVASAVRAAVVLKSAA
jgi:hypothetical protein